MVGLLLFLLPLKTGRKGEKEEDKKTGLVSQGVTEKPGEFSN